MAEQHAETVSEQRTKEQEQYCKQLETFYQGIGNKPVYTMEIIKFAANAIAGLTEENPNCSFMDIDGKVHDDFDHSLILRVNQDSGTKAKFEFWSYQELATNLGLWARAYGLEDENWGPYLNHLAEKKIPCFHFPWAHPDHPPLREDDLRQVEAMWKETAERKEIMSYFQKKSEKEQTTMIKKIVCFGLGCLSSVNLSKLNEGQHRIHNLYHHLVAFDIADALKASQVPVPIIFQDPIYRKHDHAWLQKLADERGIQISFIENPRGLLEVDENTLVLAHGSPAFPVSQLIVDVTKPFNGPAGFFCNTIPKIVSAEDELKEFELRRMNPPTRRVASMEADYNMRAVFTINNWSSTMYMKQK
ncbi:uncharacterized protein K460DRAFT_399734 [Cucurbitaria berberidis CBS 394.84]|uniref:SRR1-like domain-containing protein n=1 Tax=Cucurbitaria berberidis CBS 394.84 TaxID=1168544 RepID=A0A9P4LC27_9PLEO|nr:uncharacterized protein K460DRAFT_399734 [Cucurbitaria berberidis CBS 394.84]KAF1849620.1 hypothetical protein K460DRAFT_399734 [Cucurbitaria berberidis CBS 394.84]